jgi:hypothetical protein
MARRRHAEGMAYLVISGIIAFFSLAAIFGADSRPYDARQRRWL